MEIITWNLNRSFRSDAPGDPWDYCLAEIEADYYLVQDARPPPEGVYEECDVVWTEIGGTRRWGSGIVSQNHDLRETEIDTDFRGAMMVAESEYTDELEVTLISLYGLMEKIGGVGYSITNLHRMVSDLTDLLEGQTHGKRNAVLGGDMNASRQIDDIYDIDTHRIFFERVEAFGLANCFDPFYDDYVHTLRHNRSDREWQNDYLFISDSMRDTLRSCEALDNENIREYSDHNPVRITLDTD